MISREMEWLERIPRRLLEGRGVTEGQVLGVKATCWLVEAPRGRSGRIAGKEERKKVGRVAVG